MLGWMERNERISFFTSLMANKSPYPCQVEVAFLALTQEHRQPESAPPSSVFVFSRILFLFQPFFLSYFSPSPAKKTLSHVLLPSILQAPSFYFFFSSFSYSSKKTSFLLCFSSFSFSFVLSFSCPPGFHPSHCFFLPL